MIRVIPESWQGGEVRGLRARENLSVGLEWREGRLVRAEISNPGNGAFRVRCPSFFVARQADGPPLSPTRTGDGLWIATVPNWTLAAQGEDERMVATT